MYVAENIEFTLKHPLPPHMDIGSKDYLTLSPRENDRHSSSDCWTLDIICQHYHNDKNNKGRAQKEVEKYGLLPY